MNRVVSFWVSKSLEFNTNEERDEFHRAIGRMVCYGLPNNIVEDPCNTQVVALAIDEDMEMTAAYYGVQHSYPKYKAISDALKEYKEGTPFVMGGILRDGKYSFHS